jgi:LPXTG-motif cell wall-anchored protein
MSLPLPGIRLNLFPGPEKNRGVIQVFKKLASFSATVVVGLVAAIGFAPSAQAYPEVVINISVGRTVVFGLHDFTAVASANVTCNWTLEWNGVTRTRAGHKTFTTTFRAPNVSRVTRIPLHATCVYTVPSGARAVTSRTTATTASQATWRRTIVITVLPARGTVTPPSQGGIPNTGGPDLWILLAGLGLVATGGAVVVRSKRRHTSS